MKPRSRRILLLAPAAPLVAAACAAPAHLDPIDLDAASGPAPEDLSSEADLAERYEAEVEAPFLALPEATFEGVDGVILRYRVVPAADPKAAVLLLTGRTEPALKHAENVWDLVDQGYTVYALDHRGQGASDRMLDEPEKGFVEFFSDYVDDTRAFLDAVVRPEAPPRVFLIAHSLGGAVGAMLLAEDPDALDGAVLSSPMIAIDAGAFPKAVAQTLAEGACSRGGGDDWALGQGPYDPSLAFEDNVVSHSEVRWSLKMAMLEEHADLRLGGVTWRWLCEALWAGDHLARLGDDVEDRVLVLRAGDDQVVRQDAEVAWCEAAPGCQEILYEDAFHEVLSETDEVRNHALAMSVRFFDALVEAP